MVGNGAFMNIIGILCLLWLIDKTIGFEKFLIAFGTGAAIGLIVHFL